MKNSPAIREKFLFRIWLFCTTTQSLEFHPFRAPEWFVPNMMLENWAKVTLDCLWDLDIISFIWPLTLLGLQSSAASKLRKSYSNRTSFTYQPLFLQCSSSGQLFPITVLRWCWAFCLLNFPIISLFPPFPQSLLEHAYYWTQTSLLSHTFRSPLPYLLALTITYFSGRHHLHIIFSNGKWTFLHTHHGGSHKYYLHSHWYSSPLRNHCFPLLCKEPFLLWSSWLESSCAHYFLSLLWILQYRYWQT